MITQFKIFFFDQLFGLKIVTARRNSRRTSSICIDIYAKNISRYIEREYLR